MELEISMEQNWSDSESVLFQILDIHLFVFCLLCVIDLL